MCRVSTNNFVFFPLKEKGFEKTPKRCDEVLHVFMISYCWGTGISYRTVLEILYSVLGGLARNINCSPASLGQSESVLAPHFSFCHALFWKWQTSAIMVNVEVASNALMWDHIFQWHCYGLKQIIIFLLQTFVCISSNHYFMKRCDRYGSFRQSICWSLFCNDFLFPLFSLRLVMSKFWSGSFKIELVFCMYSVFMLMFLGVDLCFELCFVSCFLSQYLKTNIWRKVVTHMHSFKTKKR